MTPSMFAEFPEPTEWIYYATDGYNIKIGRTDDRPRRGGQLAVTMLLTIPTRSAVLDEKRHHRMWAAYRINGTEWFRPSDELLLWITSQMEPRSRELAVLQAIIRRANEKRRAA